LENKIKYGEEIIINKVGSPQLFLIFFWNANKVRPNPKPEDNMAEESIRLGFISVKMVLCKSGFQL